jgi:hypothetical protein
MTISRTHYGHNGPAFNNESIGSFWHVEITTARMVFFINSHGHGKNKRWHLTAIQDKRDRKSTWSHLDPPIAFKHLRELRPFLFRTLL